MKLDFTGIINFNKKFKRQTDIRDKKREELNKANASLKRLEEQLSKLREKEYHILSRLPEGQASIKLEENRAKQEKKQGEIEKKKERVSSINATYQKYEQRYLKLVSQKNTAIIDIDLKIAKLEDKIDKLRQQWGKAAEKVNENYAKMRKINKDSQEYKDLEEENEKHREVMRNSVITSETGMKLKNELDNLKNMKRILENGEIIEELVKEPAQKESTKVQPATKTEKTDVASDSKVVNNKTTEESETKKDEKAKTTVYERTEIKGTTSSAQSTKTVSSQGKTTKVTPTVHEPKKTTAAGTTKTVHQQTKSQEQQVNSEQNVDKVLEKYKNDGFVKNAFGWYFDPWKSEFDPEYDPHNDEEYNEELKHKNSVKQHAESEIRTTDSREPFYKKVIELLKTRFRNIMQRINNYNNKRLMEGTAKEEYVAKANKVMEETLKENHVFDANSRAAMLKSREKFVGTIKIENTYKPNEKKEPIAVTSEPTKTEKDNGREQ